MAEAQAETKAPQPAKKQPVKHSQPVLRQTLSVYSLQAQRVVDRNFARVARALFSIGVILRIIGEDSEVDEVEKIIETTFANADEELTKLLDKLEKLKEDHGIEAEPEYTAPKQYPIDITSPHVSRYVYLIRRLDKLMMVVDTLWLSGVLDSRQRSDATYEWQQRLMNMGGRIVGIEKRSRLSAERKGKEKQVQEAAPNEDNDDTSNEDATSQPEAAEATANSKGEESASTTKAKTPKKTATTAKKQAAEAASA